MPFTSAPGTFTGTTSEWLISHTTFSGDVINAGVIGISGIVVISSTFTNGRLIDGGTLIGGIHIDGSSKILASNTAIVVEGPSTFGGGIRNAGILSAGHDDIHILQVSTFSGGITNSGQLAASTGDGIVVSSSVGVFASGTAGGGIANSGTITAGSQGICVGGRASDPGGKTVTSLRAGSGMPARSRRAAMAFLSAALSIKPPPAAASQWRISPAASAMPVPLSLAQMAFSSAVTSRDSLPTTGS